MAVLHGLYFVGTLGNAQRKLTLRVSDNDLLTGIVHHLAVELERNTRYRYRSIFIVHITRVDKIGVHPEVKVCRPVTVLTERCE